MKPLPEDERHFKAAFVVISAEPAPDAVLEEVAKMARIFGNREEGYTWSFEHDTGGRATMDTELGARRKQNEPAPEPRPAFECDLIAQDCGKPEVGCFGFDLRLCAVSDQLGEGEVCDGDSSCAPGLGCVASTPGDYRCAPYCDVEDTASPKACASLCPTTSLTVTSPEGDTLGAICLPE